MKNSLVTLQIVCVQAEYFLDKNIWTKMHCTHKMQFSSGDLNQWLSLQNPAVLFYLQNSNNPNCRDEHCFSARAPLRPGPQWKHGAVSWLSLTAKFSWIWPFLFSLQVSVFPIPWERLFEQSCWVCWSPVYFLLRCCLSKASWSQ